MEKSKTQKVPAARSPEIPKCGRKFHVKKGVVVELYAPLAYLAVPYSHKDPAVMAARFNQVNVVAASLMKKGITLFSPISQNHPVALAGGLPVEWEYWEKFGRNFLACCHTLYVLKLDGWKESVGVQAEIKIATEMGLDIIYLDPIL